MNNQINIFSLDHLMYRELEDKIGYNLLNENSIGIILNSDNRDYFLPLVSTEELSHFSQYSTENIDKIFHFNHVIPLSGEKEYTFNLQNNSIHMTLRKELTQIQDEIVESLEGYLANYKEVVLAPQTENIIDTLQDSTLPYFHQELQLEVPIHLDKDNIQDALSQESELVMVDIQSESKRFENRIRIDELQKLDLVLIVEVERNATYIEDSNISPWSISLWQNEQNLGTLCYGDNWSESFEIYDDLSNLENVLEKNAYQKLYQNDEMQEIIEENKEKFQLLKEPAKILESSNKIKVPIQEMLEVVRNLEDDILAKNTQYTAIIPFAEHEARLKLVVESDKPCSSIRNNDFNVVWGLELQYEDFLDSTHRLGIAYGSLSEITNIKDSLEHLQLLYDQQSLSSLYPIEEVDEFIKNNTDMFKAIDTKQFIQQLPVFVDGERVKLADNLLGIDYAIDTVSDYEIEFGENMDILYDNLIVYDMQDPSSILCVSSSPKKIVEEINALLDNEFPNRLYDFDLVPEVQEIQKYDLALTQAELLFSEEGLFEHLKNFPEQVSTMLEFKENEFYEKYYNEQSTPVNWIGITQNFDKSFGITSAKDGNQFFNEEISKLQEKYPLFTSFPSGLSPSTQAIQYISENYPEYQSKLSLIDKNQLKLWLPTLNQLMEEKGIQLHYAEIVGENLTQTWQVYLVRDTSKVSIQETDKLMNYLSALYKDELKEMSLVVVDYYRNADNVKAYPLIVNTGKDESILKQIKEIYPELTKDMKEITEIKNMIYQEEYTRNNDIHKKSDLEI